VAFRFCGICGPQPLLISESRPRHVITFFGSDRVTWFSGSYGVPKFRAAPRSAAHE